MSTQALMSLAPSRALVAPGRGLSGQPLAAPWWRSLVGRALAAGACRWRVRTSGRSFSGAVVVAGFAEPGAAVTFAAAWSAWCGLSLAVRRYRGRSGAVWGVSVPVATPPALALAAAPGGLTHAAWVRS